MKFLQILFWIALLGEASVAQPSPHIAYAYPAGGRIGTEFQVVVGGQALGSISNVFFSGDCIDGVVVEVTRPMSQKDFKALRDRFRELEEKFQAARRGGANTNVWTAMDSTEFEQARRKLLKGAPNRQANQAMVDAVTLHVSIATNAQPGEQELRVSGANGLSNPLKFFIGTLPEITKPQSRSVNPDLERFLGRLSGRPVVEGTPKYEARVSLPALINGQIMPGGVDRYRFAANRGQQIVIAIAARQVIPFLADAVPGWFEAVLTVRDVHGKELLTQERFGFRPDPILCFNVPSDGQYVLEVHDSIFRGREDFVYRLMVGEEAFVTAVFPMGGKQGEKSSLALTGWNLAEKTLSFEPTQDDSRIVRLPGPFLNSVPFAVDELPECLEQRPNDSTETAQMLTLPIIVNGRISKPGERAFFKFQAQAGRQIVAEVEARRLGSPLDSFLRLTDTAGNQLAFNDDFEDKGSGLETHHADSYLMTEIPADGSYVVQLGDAQGRGGADFSYRLRVSEAHPDFALRVVPSSINLRSGMSSPLTVFALRRDGFTNAIRLSLKDGPPGFSLSGAQIQAGADKVQFTLRAAGRSFDKPVKIAIAGQALICGQSVLHTAVPCEEMMQAFAYRHLVPSKELLVQVNGAQLPFARDAFKIVSALPVKISRGGTASLRISTPSSAFLDRFALELENAPEGISLEKVSAEGNEVEIEIKCGAADSASNGNVLCRILPRNPGLGSTKTPAGANKLRRAVGSLPAIPVEIR
ncbi:MAG TPA: hypothetical protein VKY92_27795 [Verrucomicrobiae bacterium]|nr:hypothetical protein [Verrucomicrobiae bacterium]